MGKILSLQNTCPVEETPGEAECPCRLTQPGRIREDFPEEGILSLGGQISM